MNISFNKASLIPAKSVLLAGCLLAASFCASHAAVLPAHSKPHGKSYSEWSAAWWQWAMSLPLAGHPISDDPTVDLSSGQSGKVWFLASPFGTVERSVTIPAGTFIFMPVLNAEASDLEGLGVTEAEQRETASFLASHIQNPAVTIDGEAVPSINRYRVSSSQFTFDAPSPWIFGATGGTGTAVADGYFLMLSPLAIGTHVIHVTGAFHFAVAEGDPFDFDATADVTYRITVR